MAKTYTKKTYRLVTPFAEKITDDLIDHTKTEILPIYLQSVTPNKYDAMALLHEGPAIASAHGGPNFPSWHRYYLYL